MNKSKLIAAVAAGVFALSLTVGVVSYSNHNVITQNVEALTSGEFDPMGACSLYCRSNYSTDCVLTTNAGFDVTCEHMRTN